MRDFIRMTFGGLSAQYYLRQLFFGAVLAAFVLWSSVQGNHAFSFGTLIYCIINTLLYPYSRFVYEQVVGFIIGNNVFFANALIVLFVKLMTMAICWAAAVVVAPFGLLWLYLYHRRAV